MISARQNPREVEVLEGLREGGTHFKKGLLFFLSAGPAILLFAARGCFLNPPWLRGHRMARIVHIDQQRGTIEHERDFLQRLGTSCPIRYFAGPRAHITRPVVPQPLPPPRFRPPELKQKVQTSPLLFVVALSTQASPNSIGPLTLYSFDNFES